MLLFVRCVRAHTFRRPPLKLCLHRHLRFPFPNQFVFVRLVVVFVVGRLDALDVLDATRRLLPSSSSSSLSSLPCASYRTPFIAVCLCCRRRTLVTVQTTLATEKAFPYSSSSSSPPSSDDSTLLTLLTRLDVRLRLRRRRLRLVIE